MHNPFKSLEINRRLQAKTAKRSHRSHPPDPSPEDLQSSAVIQTSEEDIFLHAVSDVAPLRKGGRDIAAPVRTAAPAPAPAATFDRLVEDHIEFDMEHTHEFIMGQVRGLDPKIFRKLKAGQLSVQAHLDLHGLNADQAKLAVIEFLRRSYMEGKRCVLVIPGRGRNSLLGQGILRQEISTWLTQAPSSALFWPSPRPCPGTAAAEPCTCSCVRHARSGARFWEDVFVDVDG